MELKQYAAEHIIENGKHYPEKWVNRYFIEVADAQRALDVEREKVKRLSTCGTDHSTPWWQVKCEDLEAQLATLQAQLADEQQRADRAVKDRSEVLDVKTKEGLSCSEWLMRTATAERKVKGLQAQLADRDAMILQMGEQAAVLAKENMAVKAQLRQAEGQSQQQAEEAVIVFAKYTTLQQLLEDVLHTFGYLRFHRVAGMDGLLYETHNKMSPERTVEACEKRIRATLAAKDAPLTDEQRDIRDCCEKPHDCKWGGLGGCGYEGRNNERANAAQIEGGA